MERSRTAKKVAIIAMLAALTLISVNGVSAADVPLQEAAVPDPSTDPITDPVTDPVTDAVDEVVETVEGTVDPSSEPPPTEEPAPPSDEGGGQEAGDVGSETTSPPAGSDTSVTTTTGGDGSVTATPVTLQSVASPEVVPLNAAPVVVDYFSADPLSVVAGSEPIESLLAPGYTPVGGPRSTLQIIEMLERVNASPDTIARILAPFPVLGRASYTDDWGAPRLNPYPHSHEGTDIFAESGTPVIACAEGVVTNMTPISAVGGTSVKITAADGSYCYYAHLGSFAFGLFEGKSVELGETLGFVGTSGNAEGGFPHLHFEIHLRGGPAVPPVPYLDYWVAASLRNAQAYVRTFRGDANPLSVVAVKLAGVLSRSQISQPVDAAASTSMPPLLVPVLGTAALLLWRRRRRSMALATGKATPDWWVKGL